MIENPCGLDGFAFLEFSSTNIQDMQTKFHHLGFTKVASHPNQSLEIWQQNQIIFILNNIKNSQAEQHAKTHGSAACSMGFQVKDKQKSYLMALDRGAKPANQHPIFQWPAIQGIGGSVIYFCDKIDYKDFFINKSANIHGAGLCLIDHLTHNVYRGQLKVWSDFYHKVFNFYEIRDFNIQGQHTGLYSQALSSPCGKIKIPLNESKDDKSQIEEFLQDFNGEGIQHIALSTNNIYETISKLQNQGVHFLDTPNTYFEMIPQRLPWQLEPIAELQSRKILIDGGPKPEQGILLQIFTENLFGPVFFEIIQRKGNHGFGEGNFQALFEAIERDQILRGKLEAR